MGDANCTISINKRFGAIRVKATRVVHGMNVVAYNAGGESRHGAAFYSSKRTSGSFDLTLQFGSYAGYHRVAQWLRSYIMWAGDPRTLATPIRVRIPSRDFDKYGALEGEIPFGDEVAKTTYQMQLAFVGSRDPMEMGGKAISKFHLPKVEGDPSIKYMYPAGTQLAGQQNGWDTAYDFHSDEALPDDTPISLPDIPIGPLW